MPSTSSADAARDAARDAAAALTQALMHPGPATPFAEIGTHQMQALNKLASIFAQAVKDPVTLPRVTAVDNPVAPPRVEPAAPALTILAAPPRVAQIVEYTFGL
jgi:hypothetical protein